MASDHTPSTPTKARPKPILTTPKTQHRRTNSLGHASPVDIVPRSPAARRMSMTSTSQSASITPETAVDRLLGREQVVLAGIVSSLMLTGIMYSLVYGTSLDTSQIYHAHTSIPTRTAYFAQKSNLFNVVFVKQAWGWTSLLYLLHLFTAPSSVSTSVDAGIGSRARRLGVWVLATGAWLLFTRWFFGAGLGDRIIAATGGNCAVPLPKSIDLTAARKAFPTLFTAGSQTPLSNAQTRNDRIYVPLPARFCTGIPLNPSTLPDLFKLLPKSAGHGVQATDDHESLQALPRPRWHRGFDISGHAFLLTLSIMVLGRELVETWRRWATVNVERQDQGWLRTVHRVSGVAATCLMGIWAFMLFMTAIYFHAPPEKLSGLVLGLTTSHLINTLIPASTPTPMSATTATPAFSKASSSGTARQGGLSTFDENAARREGIVDDGVIYEVEESEDEGGAGATRSRDKVFRAAS
ncbi:hypothetical protein IAU60_006753 [Kwoniella sp. DSM 27419]